MSNARQEYEDACNKRIAAFELSQTHKHDKEAFKEYEKLAKESDMAHIVLLVSEMYDETPGLIHGLITGLIHGDIQRFVRDVDK